MNKVWWLLLVLMVVPLVAGCDPVVEIRVMTERDLTATSGVINPVTSMAETPTVGPDTPGAMAATSPPPTVIPSSSPTPQPPPTPTRPPATATTGPQPSATRIRFQTGAISATLSGQLGPHGSSLYVLWAAAGQIMEITVVPTESGVSFAIWGEDGTVLKQHAEDRAGCVLPSSQDYFVALYSGEQATRYDLTVMISPRGGSEPTRVRFAPGATSALREGSLAPGACAYYVLGARAGQRMEAQVSPGEVVGLEVLGQDGSLWSSGPAGTLIVERLPQTGDYYLTLCIPSWAEATRYTLEVTIPPR